ncbi:PGG domain containing protein [Trema orientale]|uniref:PGG domain containing protein n=1 Tax=Trema orientale TaxID=63057 RepID=A0A2P5APW1_TREOI|nr:PGG domain containing protein [Trema orientale]
MKLIHTQCFELLHVFSEIIKTSDHNQIKDALRNAIFEATGRGFVEFLISLKEINPDILTWCTDGDTRMNIFLHSIKFRQADIYNLLYGLRSKEIMVDRVDKDGNNALHMVAFMPPFSALSNKAGPALKMQSELQWFKEIENTMPPHYAESKNSDGMTPRELFSKNHGDLMIEGEKWMKETASFCIVSSALVVTIMFAAAITIPGGNDQNTGFPMFQNKKLFKVFMISDIFSVFSSTVSVLEFLGVITSRYAEEDFLKALPTKMTTGVACLLFSVATMMLSFCAVIFTMFKEDLEITILICVLAIFPVYSLAMQVFPLLVEIFVSTYYGPSIFREKGKL